MSDHRIFATFRIEKGNRDKLVEPEGIMSLSNMLKSREWIQVVCFKSITDGVLNCSRTKFDAIIFNVCLFYAKDLLERFPL